jgi:hypothetical protein
MKKPVPEPALPQNSTLILTVAGSDAFATSTKSGADVGDGEVALGDAVNTDGVADSVEVVPTPPHAARATVASTVATKVELRTFSVRIASP